MTSHLEIYRTAKALIEEHGDEAPLIAGMRAEAMSGRHDVQGTAMWLGIVRAIKVLTSRTPGESD